MIRRFSSLGGSAVASYSVLNGTIMKSLRSKIVFFFPAVVIGGFYYAFEAYSLVFPEYSLLSSIKKILFFLLFVSFCTVLISWSHLLCSRYRVNKTLNYEEKKECVYMMSMIFFVVACQIVNGICTLGSTQEKKFSSDTSWCRSYASY